MFSMSEQQDPKGRILKTSHHPDGTSRVVLDNGVVDTITIVTHSEDLAALLSQDMRTIREHLLTRRNGHFRSKRAR